MADTLTRLRRPADLRPERGRVLSVYMDLDPSEFATPPARASLVTSLITDARHQVDALADLSHDELKSLRNDVEAVREALTQPGIADDGARGAAVFACELAGLFETIRLPYPIASRVVIDETPWVEPLLRARAERWCVLLANRRNARVFVGPPRELEETDRVEDNVHSQHKQGGWSQPRYQRSIEEDVRDHLDHVVAVVFARLKAHAFDRLLVGAPQETLGDLERRLHPYLRERLEGHVRLDVENAAVDNVREAAAAAVEEIEVRREAEALERLREGIGAGGRAAAGPEDVQRALDEARVATLLLADGYESNGDRAVEKALDSGAD